MRRGVVCVLTGVLLPFFAPAQGVASGKGVSEPDTALRSVVEYFQKYRQYTRKPDPSPALLVTKNFTVTLGDSALHLRKRTLNLINPFGPEKYPLSYSVLYRNRLVSLLAPGSFACFHPETGQRDTVLENRLNTRLFSRHWLLDGRLVGQSGRRNFQFDPERGWRKFAGQVPLGERNKLFEDDTYLVYNDCRGEFGGEVFFYHKRTRKTHAATSVCAVWVRRVSEGYEVLSNLGHMTGHAYKQLIPNPEALPVWRQPSKRRTDPRVDAVGAVWPRFNFLGLQIFGGIVWGNRSIYLLNVASQTFLATQNDQTFAIVDPFFTKDLYAHDPVTTHYPGITLINFGRYELGVNYEKTCFLFREGEVTQILWK